MDIYLFSCELQPKHIASMNVQIIIVITRFVCGYSTLLSDFRVVKLSQFMFKLKY